MLLKRVAITGPESTGKSWLANNLASYYNVNMVNEYAREYFQNRDSKYLEVDLVNIAKGQIDKEEYIASISNGVIFCDTDLIVMKVWWKVVFGSVPDWIQKHIKENVYDMYLLCYTDIMWEPDPLRSNRNNRQYIYNMFVYELEQNSFNYRVVNGIGKQRLKNAINFVDELLKDEG